MKNMMHNAIALGVGQKLRTEPDQTTRRNDEFQPQISRQLDHVHHFRPLRSQLFHHRAHEFRRNIDREKLQRFALLPFDFLENDLRLTHREFITLAAHRLDQHRQMQFAAATNLESVRAVRFFDAQTDVGFLFFHQPFPQMPGGDILAFLAGERAVVHQEHHRQRRFVDINGWQRFRVFRIGQRVADRKIIQTRDGDDVAHGGAFHLVTLQAVVHIQKTDLLLALGVAMQDGYNLSGFHCAANHPPHGNFSHILIVVDGRHHDL